MFKAILNFIRKLYEPKPGHCPKAIDYEWTNQEGTDVRRHEPSRKGGDPVDTLEAAVKAPKDSGEPRLVPDKRHMRTKPAEAAKDAESGEEKKPAVKKAAAKKPVVKKTVAKKPAAKKPAARKTTVRKAAAAKPAAEKSVKKTAPAEKPAETVKSAPAAEVKAPEAAPQAKAS